MSQQHSIITETLDDLDKQFNEWSKGKKTYGCQIKIMQKEGKTYFIEVCWFDNWSEAKK